MSINWKNVVEKENAEAYRLPAGWDSREKVADDLECSPERVSEVLRPALKSGAVEKRMFPVWDKLNRRVVQVTAYRTKPAKASAPKNTR